MCSASRVQCSHDMNAETEAMRQRTKKFTLDVLKFIRSLPATDECHDIGDQLRRSGGGVGANYRSTCRSRSRSEFISRINVALEEADESAFWLEVLTEGEIVRNQTSLQLLDEANQLSAIFAASSLTAIEAEKRHDPDPRGRQRR